MGQVVKCADFNPAEFFKKAPMLKNRKGNPGGKRRHYIGITTAFDIETTVIPGTTQAVMYIWQWCFNDVVVIGRTWEEFTDLQNRIRVCLPAARWLVVYVHSLSHEFQYLKGIYKFSEDDVFATASRQILKADMYGCFEFRCSYKLTNMSLHQFTERMKVEHQKLSGDEFDYSKIRYPWTELTDREIEYCVNDVLGLVEAVNALLARDGDTLQTIPLTSTGYVRRDVKQAMRNGLHHNYVASMLPDWEVYEALHEAFRGGNTHANRLFTGVVVKNVHSADESSAYPACLCNCLYPSSRFIEILPHDLNMDYIIRCIDIRHKALLLRIGIKGLRLRDPYWGCPYLSRDKCREIRAAVYELDGQMTEMADNGRIIEADYLETTITDIDLKIICSEYTGEIIILQGWYASYKKLPEQLTGEIIKYYKNKTELKNVEGQELYYDKAKSLLNACYGMMAQNPCKVRQLFRQVGDFEPEFDEEDPEQMKPVLEKANRKAFLNFAWGVWCTAHARYRLEIGIRKAHHPEKGVYFVYADTDSVKYIGDIDWSSYNADRILECQESGAMAVDPKGMTHYMGVFETEDNPETGYCYSEFKTLGAKKYAYVKEPGGKTHVTISGVDKRKGGPELDAHGGLAAFEDDFVFNDAGGTESVYNDDPEISEMQIDGHTLQITSNVAILPSTYRLGITGEYRRIVKYFQHYIDNPYII